MSGLAEAGKQTTFGSPVSESSGTWALIPPLRLPGAGVRPTALSTSLKSGTVVESTGVSLPGTSPDRRLSDKSGPYRLHSSRWTSPKTSLLRSLFPSESVLLRGMRDIPRCTSRVDAPIMPIVTPRIESAPLIAA